MPSCLDIYVITRSRDAATLKRFVDHYVDREASEDRGDEGLMMLPLGTTDKPQDLDEWQWEPARTISHAVQRALDHPRRAFAMYLTPSDPAHYRVIVAFTADNQTVLGVSIDDETESEANLERARNILHQLVKEFKGHAGFVGWEEPPPLSGEPFPPRDVPILLYSWTQDTV